jgi:hypothetical protein
MQSLVMRKKSVLKRRRLGDSCVYQYYLPVYNGIGVGMTGRILAHIYSNLKAMINNERVNDYNDPLLFNKTSSTVVFP